jgi:hypothetical protein
VSSNERCELSHAAFEFVEELCWCCRITQVCLGQLGTKSRDYGALQVGQAARCAWPCESTRVEIRVRNPKGAPRDHSLRRVRPSSGWLRDSAHAGLEKYAAAELEIAPVRPTRLNCMYLSTDHSRRCCVAHLTYRLEVISVTLDKSSPCRSLVFRNNLRVGILMKGTIQTLVKAPDAGANSHPG